jgi:hypothetical protein
MLLKLLMAPVNAPMAGFKFILHTFQDLADRELTDEGNIRDDLLLLQLKLDEGEISEEDYLVEEAAIMERLRTARALRQQGRR